MDDTPFLDIVYMDDSFSRHVAQELGIEPRERRFNASHIRAARQVRGEAILFLESFCLLLGRASHASTRLTEGFWRAFHERWNAPQEWRGHGAPWSGHVFRAKRKFGGVHVGFNWHLKNKFELELRRQAQENGGFAHVVEGDQFELENALAKLCTVIRGATTAISMAAAHNPAALSDSMDAYIEVSKAWDKKISSEPNRDDALKDYSFENMMGLLGGLLRGFSVVGYHRGLEVTDKPLRLGGWDFPVIADAAEWAHKWGFLWRIKEVPYMGPIEVEQSLQLEAIETAKKNST